MAIVYAALYSFSKHPIRRCGKGRRPAELARAAFLHLGSELTAPKLSPQSS